MIYNAVTGLQVKTPEPHVAHIVLPRHPQHHASIESTWQELHLIFESLSCNPMIRVIVLSGTGEEDALESGKGKRWETLGRPMHSCIATILACVKRKRPAVIRTKLAAALPGSS